MTRFNTHSFLPMLAGLVVTAFACVPADSVAAEPTPPSGVLRLESFEPIEGPRHGDDRHFIEAALRRARVRSLQADKSVADRLQVEDHTVELHWPVRESVGFAQPTVQAISNFLDQDPAEDDLEDWNCGGENARTYDGHNGLDIFLSPFSWYQMEQDSGIVVAAAGGVILDKVGDQPERSCEINDDGGDNNQIIIEHADGSWGIYAHMRTDSLTAKPVGAVVEAGEYLGVIGSSGLSTGPHLHFEVGFWENNQWTPQDPYAGQCNDINTGTWWETQPAYYEPAIMSLATHSAQPEHPTCPETETPHYSDDFGSGDTIYFSFVARDLRMGETVGVEIREPDGSLIASSGYTEETNEHVASAMLIFSIELPTSAMPGNWEYRVSFAGETYTHPFRVDIASPDPAVLSASNNAYNGLWYDPALDGEGYNIVTTRGGTVLYFYGSDRNGRRLWLISELVTQPFSNGQQQRIVMYESTGGVHDMPVPSGRGLSIWGELRLTFSACDAGSARLIGEDGDKLSALVKIAGVPGSNCVSTPLGPTSPYAGLWYDPGLDGEGFNLIVAPPGSVLYYYGFDADGNRLWLATAPFDFSYANGAQITVELLRSGSGTFAAPVSGALESWGTVTITGNTCNRMDYVLDTNEGDKTMDARRLVSVVGIDC